MWNRCRTSLGLWLGVFNISNQSLNPITTLFNIELHICCPIIIEVDSKRKSSVFCLVEMVNKVIGIDKVLSKLFVHLFLILDDPQCKSKTFVGIVANSNKVDPAVLKRIFGVGVDLKGNDFGALVFLVVWMMEGLPLKTVKKYWVGPLGTALFAMSRLRMTWK